MEEAEYCHRLALMNRGRLIALDTPGRRCAPRCRAPLLEIADRRQPAGGRGAAGRAGRDRGRALRPRRARDGARRRRGARASCRALLAARGIAVRGHPGGRALARGRLRRARARRGRRGGRTERDARLDRTRLLRHRAQGGPPAPARPAQPDPRLPAARRCCWSSSATPSPGTCSDIRLAVVDQDRTRAQPRAGGRLPRLGLLRARRHASSARPRSAPLLDRGRGAARARHPAAASPPTSAPGAPRRVQAHRGRQRRQHRHHRARLRAGHRAAVLGAGRCSRRGACACRSPRRPASGTTRSWRAAT